jgi:hypothetical protein
MKKSASAAPRLSSRGPHWTGWSKPRLEFSLLFENGAPEGIRTPGLCLRRAALYPAELRVRAQAPQGRLGGEYRILAQRGNGILVSDLRV